MKNQFTFFLSVGVLSFSGLGCGNLFYAPREEHVNLNINANRSINAINKPENINAPTDAAGDSNASGPTNSSSNSSGVTISGGVLNGKAINLVKPAYPPAARAVRAPGAVNVQVVVDEKGEVIAANAVSGHPLLRASAVRAARASKFAPTILSGKPVRVTGVIVYNLTPE